MTGKEKLTAAVRAAIAHCDTVNGDLVFGDGCYGNGIAEDAAVFFATARLAALESHEKCKQEFTKYALSLLSSLSRIAEENGGALGSDAAHVYLSRGAEAITAPLPEAAERLLHTKKDAPTVSECPAILTTPENDPTAAILTLCDLAPALLTSYLSGKMPFSLTGAGTLVLPTLLSDGKTLLMPYAPPRAWLAALLVLSKCDPRFAPYAIRAAERLPMPDPTLPLPVYEKALAETAVLLALACTQECAPPSPVSLPIEEEYEDGNALLIRGKQRDASICSTRHAVRVAPKDATALYGDAAYLSHVTLSCGTRYTTESHALFPYKGGFLAYQKERVSPQNDTLPRIATLFRATAVLPDDETVLTLSLCRADTPMRILALDDRLYTLSPDLSRVYYYGDAKRTLGARAERYTNVGNYLNIADRIGIVSQSPMTVTADTDGQRHISLARTDTPIRPHTGDVLFHTAAAVAVGGIRRTRALADTFLTLDGLPHGILSVSAVAANRKRYTLLYNVTGAPFIWEDHTVAPETAALLAWDR